MVVRHRRAKLGTDCNGRLKTMNPDGAARTITPDYSGKPPDVAETPAGRKTPLSVTTACIVLTAVAEKGTLCQNVLALL